MKFTEERLEQAIIELLGKKTILLRLTKLTYIHL